MKLANRFKSILVALKQSLRRFPITIVISTLLTVSLIYFNENFDTMSMDTRDNLTRFNMVLGMAILLSLCIDLMKENLFKDNKSKTLISHILGAGFLILYYIFLLKDFDFVSITRYVGIIVFLIITYLYIPVIKNKDQNYEYRVIDIFGNFFETAIYSLVIIFGIFAIIITVDSLFDVDIDEKYYLYIFIITFFMFAVSFFLSKQPKDGDLYYDKRYSQSMRILLTYIVIPLITIYTLILYVYFAKILITWEWPKGLVSHLVIWYTAVTIGVIFLITPLIETDKISRYFKTLFPKFVLPLLLMMFLSIGQRIYQYGFTENRYYIVVLGLWITFVMLYFSIKRPLKNIIIPITLSMIVINSVLGPLSSYSISKFSQNRRLNELLSRNSMISGDNIVKNPDISNEEQREISNIINYFKNNHSLNDVKLLDNDFSTDNMEEVFGFDYRPNIWESPNNERYFYYRTELFDKPIDIVGYDYYIQFSSWTDNTIEIDDLSIMKSRNSNELLITNEEGSHIEIDIKDIAIELIDNNKIDLYDEKQQMDPGDMSYEMEEEDIKLKLIFTSISGVEIDNNVDYQDIEYVLLIKDLSR